MAGDWVSEKGAAQRHARKKKPRDQPPSACQTFVPRRLNYSGLEAFRMIGAAELRPMTASSGPMPAPTMP